MITVPITQPIPVSVLRPITSIRHGSYPPDLVLLWKSEKWNKCLVGGPVAWTDTPVVSSIGVTPGDGPSFTSVVTWADGGTRVWEITMGTASADLVVDVDVGGGLSVNSTGLKFSDGTNTATVATSWSSGEVVTAVVQVTSDGWMRLWRVN